MASSVQLAKRALRETLKQKLKLLSKTDKDRQSRIVCERLLQSPLYQRSNRVSLFLSMDDEVDTTYILQDALRQGKHCFIPQYFKSGSLMHMVRLHSWADYESLPATSWNIKQPDPTDKREEALDSPIGLDLMVVPGLGFTPEGRRIGRGKGYYDAYLARCRAHGARGSPNAGAVVTVALAFNEQICEDVPVGPSDLPVDAVIFELASAASLTGLE